MASTTETTDASNWEYTTYAPSGETCPACIQPIKTLERVRRGTMERASGAPVVIDRHADRCPEVSR